MVATLLVALSGCSYGLNPPRLTAGSVFDVDRAREVRGGLQASSLGDLFGPPFLLVPDDDGGETWYYFMRYESSSVTYVFGLIPLKSTSTTATCVTFSVRDAEVVSVKVTETSGRTECEDLRALADGPKELPQKY